MNVLDYQKMKDEGRKISMVTCYDYSSARAVAESSIDCILVGDSLAMTMHGHPNTLAATTAMIRKCILVSSKSNKIAVQLRAVYRLLKRRIWLPHDLPPR